MGVFLLILNNTISKPQLAFKLIKKTFFLCSYCWPCDKSLDRVYSIWYFLKLKFTVVFFLYDTIKF